MRKITVTCSFQGRTFVPMIRLRGKWLEIAGFEEGMFVQVEVTAGRMTLTAVDKPPNG